MSLRAVAHKLTEDRVPTPTWARKFQEQPLPEGEEIRLEHCLWRPATISEMLQDLENIGVLMVCKEKDVLGPDGKLHTQVHPARREIPGGIPAIIAPMIYERALGKLNTNKADKSHLPQNPESFLLRGHIYCSTCGHSMRSVTMSVKGAYYPAYRCVNTYNKYGACPLRMCVRTSPLDEIVWSECCMLFKLIDELQAILKKERDTAINSLLEGTTGQVQLEAMEVAIAAAKEELVKHQHGSYTYNLISADIARQEAELARYREEIGSVSVESVLGSYQQQIMAFLDFLNVMRGNYESATFQQKRNALEVLGAHVLVREYAAVCGEGALDLPDGKEWFSSKEAAQLLGITPKMVQYYCRSGLITNYKAGWALQLHRDELLKLYARGFNHRNTEDVVRERVEITFSPKFASVFGGQERNPSGALLCEEAQRF